METKKRGLDECRSVEATGGGLQGKIRVEQGGQVVAMTKGELGEALKGGEVSGQQRQGGELLKQKEKENGRKHGRGGG